MTSVDHAGGSVEFLKKIENAKFHDMRLWELRQKRDVVVAAIPEWEELRVLASDIKEHALSNLAGYLQEFELNATRNGAHVHWAADAEEHNRIVFDLLSARGVTTLVKSKSMLTEECDLRSHLEDRGILVVETDLGERIQQLDNEPPSHIVVPAVHKLRGDVAAVFADTLGTDRNNSDPHYLSKAQRESTRPLILGAGAGMTGANFIVAESGSVVVCTNEGNADLCGSVPNLHIVSVGIEKVVPRLADLGVFIRMLSRSALGSPITQYTSHFRAPRHDGEMHIVLVDNGRSTRLGMADYWPGLKCIRCGACMNTCPVYRRSGGLSYGAVYSGPIGAILNPAFDPKRFASLPFASTLNGSCTNVCPVRINIHEQLYKWRRRLAETKQIPVMKRYALQATGAIMARPRLYRFVLSAGRLMLKWLPTVVARTINLWGQERDLPRPEGKTFHDWYLKNRRPM